MPLESWAMHPLVSHKPGINYQGVSISYKTKAIRLLPFQSQSRQVMLVPSHQADHVGIKRHLNAEQRLKGTCYQNRRQLLFV